MGLRYLRCGLRVIDDAVSVIQWEFTLRHLYPSGPNSQIPGNSADIF